MASKPRDSFLCGYHIPVHLADLRKEGAEGMWMPQEKMILLDRQLSDEAKVEVFLHEAVEAVNSTYDLRLPHWKIQTLGLALFEMLGTSGVLSAGQPSQKRGRAFARGTTGRKRSRRSARKR